MSKKPICAQLPALLLIASPAFAQDANWQVEGSATVGGIYNSTHDTKDASKFEEYRDLGNGALSNIFVRGRRTARGSTATARISAATTST